MIDGKSHNCIDGIFILFRLRLTRAAGKAWMIPAEHRVFQCNWRGHDAHLIEASVALRADDQRLAVADIVVAIVNEECIDFVRINCFHLIAYAIVLLNQFGTSRDQRGSCKRQGLIGIRLHTPRGTYS